MDTITQIVEKRRTCVWYDDVKNYYEGILQVAKMQAFFKEHSAGFHTVEPAKVWKEYTTEYYIMDTYYREFHKTYSESLKNYHEELSDLFTHVMEKVEGLYSTWFLGQLGNNWSDACADNLREYGRVLEVPQQMDFYRQKIAASGSKVYVIMRYTEENSISLRCCNKNDLAGIILDLPGPKLSRFFPHNIEKPQEGILYERRRTVISSKAWAWR